MINLKKIINEKDFDKFNKEERFLLKILFDPKILISVNIPKIDEEDDNIYEINEIILKTFINLFEKNIKKSIDYALEQFSISIFNNIIRPILLKINITKFNYKNLKDKLNLSEIYKLQFQTKYKDSTVYYGEDFSDDLYYIRVINNKIFINDKNNNFYKEICFNFLKPLKKDLIFFVYKKNDIFYIFDWLPLEEYYKNKSLFILEDRLDFLEYIHTLIDNNTVKISEKTEDIDNKILLTKKESFFEFNKSDVLVKLKLK